MEGEKGEEGRGKREEGRGKREGEGKERDREAREDLVKKTNLISLFSLLSLSSFCYALFLHILIRGFVAVLCCICRVVELEKPEREKREKDRVKGEERKTVTPFRLVVFYASFPSCLLSPA